MCLDAQEAGDYVLEGLLLLIPGEAEAALCEHQARGHGNLAMMLSPQSIPASIQRSSAANLVDPVGHHLLYTRKQTGFHRCSRSFEAFQPRKALLIELMLLKM